MSYFEAFILGLVQGLGEFLPISSSAHLVVAPWFFQFKDPGLAFDVALHLGTLFAVLAYFWKDWFRIFNGSLWFLLKRHDARGQEGREDFRLFRDLVLATLPAAIAGVFLEDYAESVLRHPLIVATTMLILGAVLFFADRQAVRDGKTLREMPTSTAVLIGLAQALALVPGVSRSGVTITAALLLGLGRTTAARFSFLLSTPIIFGACILKYKYFIAVFQDPQAVFGIVVAAVFGFLSIKYLMKLVSHFSYRAFCYYRFLFGAGVFGIYFLRG